MERLDSGGASQERFESGGSRARRVAGVVRNHTLAAIGLCLLLASIVVACLCPLASGGLPQVNTVEGVCQRHGLERRYAGREPQRARVLGHPLFRRQYTTDTGLDPIWDLVVYYDADGRVRALAAQWWFEPGLSPPSGTLFEPALMDPFEVTGLGVFRKTCALKELEILNASGDPSDAMMMRRRAAVLRSILQHTSASVVTSECVSAQLTHPVYATGGFFRHQLGPWGAVSYHAGGTPAAGDYGMPYMIIDRSLCQ